MIQFGKVHTSNCVDIEILARATDERFLLENVEETFQNRLSVSKWYLENVDRLLAEHPTPHPNWESRPGTPLVIFLGVG